MDESKATFELKLEEDFLKDLNLDSYKKLNDMLNLYKVSLNELSVALEYGAEIEFDFMVERASSEEYKILATKREDDLIECYDSFRKEFKKRTGLSVRLIYAEEHDKGFFALDFDDIYKETELSKSHGGVSELFTLYHYNN